ncbi:MAG: hypothetical protein GXC73_18120 [Chitinophagaceae bacterium]|nr:hypothetical protein [Chitinophagaceae bacterium]
MNITITDPKATETHQKYYRTLLNHSGKNGNLILLIYLAIGLLLISYDLSNFNDCSFKLNTGLLKGKLLNNEMECINLHLSLGIGIGFCLLSLSSLLSLSRYKEKSLLQYWKKTKPFMAIPILKLQ